MCSVGVPLQPPGDSCLWDSGGWKAFFPVQGAPAALCTNRTFLFGTRLVTSVMPQIGQHLEK